MGGGSRQRRRKRAKNLQQTQENKKDPAVTIVQPGTSRQQATRSTSPTLTRSSIERLSATDQTSRTTSAPQLDEPYVATTSRASVSPNRQASVRPVSAPEPVRASISSTSRRSLDIDSAPPRETGERFMRFVPGVGFTDPTPSVGFIDQGGPWPSLEPIRKRGKKSTPRATLEHSNRPVERPKDDAKRNTQAEERQAPEDAPRIGPSTPDVSDEEVDVFTLMDRQLQTQAYIERTSAAVGRNQRGEERQAPEDAPRRGPRLKRRSKTPEQPAQGSNQLQVSPSGTEKSPSPRKTTLRKSSEKSNDEDEPRAGPSRDTDIFPTPMSSPPRKKNLRKSGGMSQDEDQSEPKTSPSGILKSPSRDVRRKNRQRNVSPFPRVSIVQAGTGRRTASSPEPQESPIARFRILQSITNIYTDSDDEEPEPLFGNTDIPPGGSHDDEPQPEGSNSDGHQAGGSHDDEPQPEGSNSDGHQAGGSHDDEPQPGGSRNDEPQPGCSHNDEPQPGCSRGDLSSPGSEEEESGISDESDLDVHTRELLRPPRRNLDDRPDLVDLYRHLFDDIDERYDRPAQRFYTRAFNNDDDEEEEEEEPHETERGINLREQLEFQNYVQQNINRIVVENPNAFGGRPGSPDVRANMSSVIDALSRPSNNSSRSFDYNERFSAVCRRRRQNLMRPPRHNPPRHFQPPRIIIRCEPLGFLSPERMVRPLERLELEIQRDTDPALYWNQRNWVTHQMNQHARLRELEARRRGLESGVSAANLNRTFWWGSTIITARGRRRPPWSILSDPEVDILSGRMRMIPLEDIIRARNAHDPDNDTLHEIIEEARDNARFKNRIHGKDDAGDKKPDKKPDGSDKKPDEKPGSSDKKPDEKPGSSDKKPDEKPGSSDKKPDENPDESHRKTNEKPCDGEKKTDKKPDEGEKRTDEKLDDEHKKTDDKADDGDEKPDDNSKNDTNPEPYSNPDS